MSYQIAIIIPILNEEETIGKLIQHLLDYSSAKNVSEIIIVDGGSTDGSKAIVNSFISERSQLQSHQSKNTASQDIDPHFREDRVNVHSRIRYIISQKGRAIQMNTGTKIASASILYFLHADSFPPKNFDQHIIDQVEKGNQAGCFRLQFDSRHWWLRLASWLTQFHWRACRGGDQSQFITRRLFDDIGGYDEHYTIYEDNMLINELFARNQFVVINKKLQTSARRYRKHGIWKLQYHFWVIYIKKWFGADAQTLLAYYQKHIC